MTENPDDRLAALTLVAPPPASPPEWFRPAVLHGDIAYVSGQVPFRADGQLVAVGRLGEGVTVDLGYECARQCGVNLLTVVQRTVGSLQRVERVLKLTVFVASAPGFGDQPSVAHGASEVIYDVLGEAGAHARSAIGVAALPLNCPVEVEAIVAVRG